MMNYEKLKTLYVNYFYFTTCIQCATLAAGPGPEASGKVVGPVKK